MCRTGSCQLCLQLALSCTGRLLEAALGTQGVSGLLSCPGAPALFLSHFLSAREQGWLLRKGALSWVLRVQVQLLICGGIWDRFLDLQPLSGTIGFCCRIAADSAQGDQLCQGAAQIITGCAQLPRGSPTPLLGQWSMCGVGFSMP